MKRWALLVAFLYLLIIVVLTWPVLAAAFIGTEIEIAQVFTAWPYWAWLGLVVLCQLALLFVPVSVANRRPVTRRSLFLPVLVSGLMMGGMAIGACYSLMEAAARDNVARDKVTETAGGIVVGLGGLTWAIWTGVFFRMSRNANPADFVSQQCRLLLKGSILELLIAVPTHLLARSRDYCCAGFMTFVGITLGIAVMLFSFGPAVFFLFVDRWKRLHPENEDAGKLH